MPYSFGDLLMYSKEVYLHYVHQYGETFWYMRWIHPVLAGSLPIFVFRSLPFAGDRNRSMNHRLISFLLAYFWAWIGFAFHLQFFAQVNFAAYVFSVVFLLESFLFLAGGTVFDLLEFGRRTGDEKIHWRTWAGGTLYVFTLVALPLITFLSGEQVEFVGWGAEATAAGTLGILLTVQESKFVYFCVPLPFLYLIWALLRAYELGLNQRFWIGAVIIIVPVLHLYSLFVSPWSSFTEEEEEPDPSKGSEKDDGPIDDSANEGPDDSMS